MIRHYVITIKLYWKWIIKMIFTHSLLDIYQWQICIADRFSKGFNASFILISFDIIISHQWLVFSMYWGIHNIPRLLHHGIFFSFSEYSKFQISLTALSHQEEKNILGLSLVFSWGHLSFPSMLAVGRDLWVQIGMDSQAAVTSPPWILIACHLICTTLLVMVTFLASPMSRNCCWSSPLSKETQAQNKN